MLKSRGKKCFSENFAYVLNEWILKKTLKMVTLIIFTIPKMVLLRCIESQEFSFWKDWAFVLMIITRKRTGVMFDSN